MRRQKFASLKVVLSSFMVKIHFLQKVLKNGLVSEKKLMFSSPDPKVENSTFFNPSLNHQFLTTFLHLLNRT